MTSDQKLTTSSVVDNLQNAVLFRAIEEWSRKNASDIREELGLASFSATSTDPLEMYQVTKKHILSKAFNDDETLKFLMQVPRWVGFNPDATEFQSGQQVIEAAKDEAVALL